ncbi:MAG TPA: carboxyl-terminal protease, partial [Verrucomicrobiae bacterium]|nr:carboxyl-terminal protease [Verrucomicrobiae bacterium]
TTAKYYTPSHKVIHEVGITPNIIVPTTDEEDRDIRLQLTPGGVESLDQKERDRLKTAHDPQLERAEDLLKGIMLYTDRSNDRTPSDKMAAQAK